LTTYRIDSASPIAGRAHTNCQSTPAVTALKLFTSGAYDRELADMVRWLEQIADALANAPVRCQRLPSDGQSYPLLEITLTGGRSAFDVCRDLVDPLCELPPLRFHEC
jgi:hypothetical protein